jgi:hypothetical protein
MTDIPRPRDFSKSVRAVTLLLTALATLLTAATGAVVALHACGLL